MRHLSKPSDKAQRVFLNCISSITDPDLAKRLRNCVQAIHDESKTYEDAVALNILHTLPQNKSKKANKAIRTLQGQVTINEMQDVYDLCFVPKDSPGRSVYDSIMSLPQNKKCPYCFHRLVTTLDHYLAKAYYPYLSVTPANLIPSCKDCNMGKKKTSFPTSPAEELLHPYFDNIENELWLKAKVIKTSPAILDFYVDCPTQWNALLKDRVENHFNSFELNDLYGAEAAEELSNISYHLEYQFSEGGAAMVRKHLTEQALSRSNAFVNSWRTAFYNALAYDDWFCKGGFRI